MWRYLSGVNEITQINIGRSCDAKLHIFGEQSNGAPLFSFRSEPVVMYLSFSSPVVSSYHDATHEKNEQPNAKRNLKRKEETNRKRGALKH